MDRHVLNRRRIVLGAASLFGVAGAWVTASPAAAATEPDWRDYEDAGMTGRRSYESPNHGITVSWSRDWGLDAEVDPPVSLAARDDDFQTDLLSLAHDPDANTAYFQLAFMDRGTTTIAGQMDWTLSDEGLTYFFGDPEGGRVLVSRNTRRAGQVWLQYADSGAVIAVTAIQRGSALINCVMACAAEDAEEAWTVSADVLVDDDDVFQVVDWLEIDAALAVEPTPADSGTASASSASESDVAVDPAYADAGLTSPTTYESPQYGYTVEWGDPWTMRPPTDTWGAVNSDPKTGDDTLVLDDAVAKSGELLATLLIDASPANEYTPELITSSEDYPKHSTYAYNVVKLTLIDSKDGRRGSALAVWEVRYPKKEKGSLMGYQFIAIDTVGEGVQRQTRLDLHRDTSDAAQEDFATLTAAITLDGDAILLGYTAEEFSDALAGTR